MKEDKNYVLKQEVRYRKIKIPEGSVKCPYCHGTGKIRFKYSEPPFSTGGDFLSCLHCEEKGYISEDTLHEDEALEILMLNGSLIGLNKKSIKEKEK